MQRHRGRNPSLVALRASIRVPRDLDTCADEKTQTDRQLRSFTRAPRTRPAIPWTKNDDEVAWSFCEEGKGKATIGQRLALFAPARYNQPGINLSCICAPVRD
jgi:hypothetical protein